MTGIFKKDNSPRIFLGNLSVVPRIGFKSSSEQWSLFNRSPEDFDEKISKSLEEIFTFPLAESISDPSSSDLVIDVMVPDFQGGEFLLDDIPLFWRPKVKVASRLYYLKSKKVKKKFMITKKMAYGNYFNRVFSLRGFFRLKPLFDSKDLDYLTSEACYELLLKIKNEI